MNGEACSVLEWGPTGLLVRFAEDAGAEALLRAQRLMAALDASPPEGLREYVPAFTTLLCEYAVAAPADLQHARTELHRWLRRTLTATHSPVASERTIEIPVHYDGPDLASLGEHAGLAAAEVIERHLAGDYRVHCLGFAPGFPYLSGLDPRLHRPRRATPRPQVAPGSVAVGGEHAGIYTVPTAGGWHLLGTTAKRLFDPQATALERMFPLQVGDRIRFQSAAAQDTTATNSQLGPGAQLRGPSLPQAVRVLHPGIRTTVQDLGRPGWRRFGVPPGGAMDPVSAAQANLLVGNPPHAGVLEFCLHGQQLEVLQDTWFALTGRAGGNALRDGEATRLRRGTSLRFPAVPNATWGYLAVEGGFSGPTFLGSLSTNPRAALGRDLHPGDILTHAHHPAAPSWAHIARRALPGLVRRDFHRPAFLRVWPGPQWTAFTEAAHAAFFETAWTISAQSDRAGYRLEGVPLATPPGNLLSEPVAVGSIQVPPSGQPIVTMPDGPTVGGYPKLALVDPEDLAWLAQTLPGRTVQFQLRADANQ